MALVRKRTLVIQLCILVVIIRLVFIAYDHRRDRSNSMIMPPLGPGTEEGSGSHQEYKGPKKTTSDGLKKVTPPPDTDKNGKKIDPVFDLESKKRFEPYDFTALKPLQRYPMKYGDDEVGSVAFGGGMFDEMEMSNSDLMSSVDEDYARENATFFSLIRNEDLKGILDSIQSVEARFNSVYHYDWVFANDAPFTSVVKSLISNMVSGNAYFVEIPEEYWSLPSWIDVQRSEETLVRMVKEKIKYGGSMSYRHMCRFNSGFFYRLSIMQSYKYYWRVEPNIKYQCDIFHRDWFREMRENGKKYAFTLAPLELHTTVEDLWEKVNDFAKEWPQYVAENNNMEFLTEDGGKSYNMCHFWSNFEIGDMDFYRSDVYMKFFDYIDQAGGFYYSRWGDAPIHTLAVSLLLNREELFYFENSGYYHHPNGDCPWDEEYRHKHRCSCLTKNEATWDKSSCIPKWFEIYNISKPIAAPHFAFVNQHHAN